MVYVLHGVSGEDGDSGRLSPKMIPECVLKQERQRCVASKEDLHKVHAEEEEITVNYLSFFTTVTRINHFTPPDVFFCTGHDWTARNLTQFFYFL